MFEAVLYAGPGAVLSHATAVHWLGLIDNPPAQIHVSTPRRRTSLPGIRVHGRRPLERAVHRGIPVTTTAQSMLDLADVSEHDPVAVRVALARLDFRHELDGRALSAVCGFGCAGSRLLKWSIANYDPRFAHTRSRLENDWIVACEELDIPKPDAVNVHVHGIRSDNVYWDAKLIVELDGYDNHRSPAQLSQNHRNDRILRGHRWLVPLQLGRRPRRRRGGCGRGARRPRPPDPGREGLRATDGGESARTFRADSP